MALNNGVFLTPPEIEEAERHIDNFIQYVSKFYDDVDRLINGFKNDPVVEDFFRSGEFGEGRQQFLLNLATRLKEFQEKMIIDPDGAILKSKMVLDAQKNLLASGRAQVR